MKSSRNKFSLIKRVQHTYILIIALMIVPTIYSVVVSNIHSRQYNDIITNVSRANLINSIAKKEIPDELWNIVSGRKSFNEGMQYEMLEEIKDGLSRIEQTTSDKRSRQKLEVASRARLTLYRNVSRLGVNIASGGSVASSEVALDEIRSISALFSDIMQEFIVMEIESAYKTNIQILLLYWELFRPELFFLRLFFPFAEVLPFLIQCAVLFQKWKFFLQKLRTVTLIRA